MLGSGLERRLASDGGTGGAAQFTGAEAGSRGGGAQTARGGGTRTGPGPGAGPEGISSRVFHTGRCAQGTST